MTMLLSDIHLPMLITTTLSEHSQYKSLPWNNLDQLSCLWGVFTKYKKNIRDGFRLENLSWRLWYRQSVLQKKVEPKTSEDINFTTTTTEEKKRLTRTRSLPDLSQWSHQKNLLNNTSTTDINSQPQQQQKQKFFIPPSSVELVESIEEEEEEEEQKYELLIFNKKSMLNTLSSTATTALSKPVSLLSDMLQLQSQRTTENNNSGLRRCQSRYCRLDQFFLNAATA